jgi:hypothetical protein
MSPEWRASLGRFPLYWRLFSRELIRKCIDSSKGECGDTLPPQKKSVFCLKGNLWQNIVFSENYVTYWWFFGPKHLSQKINTDIKHTHNKMFKICVFINGNWEEPPKPIHVQDAGDVLWLELGFWQILGTPLDRSWVSIWQAAVRPFYRTTSVNPTPMTPCCALHTDAH